MRESRALKFAKQFSEGFLGRCPQALRTWRKSIAAYFWGKSSGLRRMAGFQASFSMALSRRA